MVLHVKYKKEIDIDGFTASFISDGEESVVLVPVTPSHDESEGDNILFISQEVLDKLHCKMARFIAAVRLFESENMEPT